MSLRGFGGIGAAVLAAGVLVGLGAGPAAAEPAFGTAAVSGPARPGPGGAAVSVRAVNVGRHGDHDRVVFRAEGGLPSWRVAYVPSVTKDGSGFPVPLEGKADLLVLFQGTAWIESPSAQPTLSPRYPGLRQVRGAGEFEGMLSYGIGQATKAGFRVFALTGPDRLVVDVAHPPGTPAATTPPAATKPAVVAPTGSSAAAAPDATVPAGTGPAATADPAPAAASGDDLADTGDGWVIPIVVIGAVLLLAGLVILAARSSRRRA